MDRVTSKDGTSIAYHRQGGGPAVILVGGGLDDGSENAPLVPELASQFTVVNYARRGRGASTDTQPYAVAREIEDVQALIAAVGGRAHVYGASSGGALALEAAAAGLDTDRLVIYEVPYENARDDYEDNEDEEFEDDEDEFPTHSIKATPYRMDDGEWGWNVRYMDEEAIHYLSCKGDGTDSRDWSYISYEVHGMGVCPVVRYTNLIDLDGRVTGEIEPVIPVLRRIDQNTYDRLIVQRFGAWKVRYITGLVKPTGMTEEDYRRGMAKLRVGDFLTAERNET